MPDTDLRIPRIFRHCGLSQGPHEGTIVKELSATYLDQYGKPLIDRVRTAHLIFRALLSQGRAFS